MKNTNEYINEVLKNYTTLKDFSAENKINYLTLWRLVNNSEVRSIIIDERTKVYLIKDLLQITTGARIKKGLQQNRNIEIRNYNPF